MPAIQPDTPRQSLLASGPSVPTTHRATRATLGVAGGVAIAIGAAIALAPRSFIDIEGEPTADLLSETRSPGVVLLAVGVFIVFAVIRRRHLHTAATMATLTYLGYGLARAASVVVDGRPASSIIGAMIVELALGVASLAAVMALSDGTRAAR